MKKLYGLLLTLAWALPAQADCLTPDAVTTLLLRRLPHLHVVNLTDQGAQTFLAAFNALPPATAYAAEQVLIFDEPGQPTDEMVLFAHGCMIKHGELPHAVLQPLIGALG